MEPSLRRSLRTLVGKKPSEIQSVQFFHPANADVSTVGIKVVLKDGSTKVITADNKGNVEIK